MTVAARAAIISLALVTSARADADRSALRRWTGGETPALAGDSLAGPRLDLRSLRGRAVLVQFWASWCEPCAVELPALSKLEERMSGRPFDVVTVNHGEGPDRIAGFLREHHVDLPVILDRNQRIARAWGVGGLPMTFLVDARGRVQGSVFGEADWTQGELAAALERVVRDAERARGARRAGTARGEKVSR